MVLAFDPAACADSMWQATAGMSVRIAIAVALVGIAGWASARRGVPGRGSFVAMVLCMAGWLLASTAEHSAADLLCKGTLAIANWIFILPLLALCALFFHQYQQQRHDLPAWPTRVLLALPVVGLMAVALSNGQHGLFYEPGTALGEPVLGMRRLHFEYGPAFVAAAATIYVLIVLSLGLVVRGYRRSQGLLRRQWLGFGVSMSLPVLANLCYFLGGWRLWGGDPTPMAFAASAVGLAVSLQSWHLFGVVPLAHRVIFAELPDPVLVLDHEQRVVEVNQAALRLMADHGDTTRLPALDHLIGQPLRSWPRAGPALAQHLEHEAKDAPAQMAGRELPAASPRTLLRLANPAAWFEVQWRVLDQQGQPRGTLLQLHDVTAHHNAQAEAVRALAARDLELANATALQALLREQAMHDPLTGLLNRRALDERFAQVTRTDLNGNSLDAFARLVLVLIDLDHFKRINDTYGHPAGDAVLRDVAVALRSGLRPNDTLFRLGGEEFGLLMTDTDQETAVRRTETLRSILACWRMGGLNEAITFSAGVAASMPQRHTLQALMDAADTALYRAKRNGRNRTETAAPDLPQPAGPMDTARTSGSSLAAELTAVPY